MDPQRVEGGMSGGAVLRSGKGVQVSRSLCTLSTALHHGNGPSRASEESPGGIQGEAAVMLCTVSTGSPCVEPVGTVLRSADPPQRTSESLRVRRAPTGEPAPPRGSARGT